MKSFNSGHQEHISSSLHSSRGPQGLLCLCLGTDFIQHPLQSHPCTAIFVEVGGHREHSPHRLGEWEQDT